MSLSQVLEALPTFTIEERQVVLRKVIELDNPHLSVADEALVQSRLDAHHLNPTSSVPLEILKEHLRSRTKQ